MTERNGCVGCKHEHESADSVGCLGCEKNAIDKYQRRTNADRIRNMNDEELTGFIFSSCTEFIECDQKYRCEECISKWLKSEVKE